MRFISLKIKGFKSFNEEQEFFFGDNNGIYYLAGKNNVDKPLGSNGAGKTSLWDALCWCLYGKTVRGVRAGDLLNWDSTKKGFSVSFLWEDSRKVHKKLIREWGPNSLRISVGDAPFEEISQERLDNVFGIPYDPFLSSVLMGQGRKMFLDLKDSERSSLFSEVFLLDKWIELSAKALSDSNMLGDRLKDIDHAITLNSERQLSTKREINNLKKLKLDWKSDLSTRVRNARRKIVLAGTELLNVQQDINVCQEDKNLLIIDFKKVTSEIEHTGRIVYRIEDRIKGVSGEMVQCHSHIEIKKQGADYFRTFAKGGDYPCTLCGQPIHKKYAAKQLLDVKIKIKRLGKKYTKKIIEKRKWKDEKSNAEEELSLLESELKELHLKINKVSSDISFGEGELRAIRREVSTKESDLVLLRKEKSPLNTDIRNMMLDRLFYKKELLKLLKIRDAVSSKKEQTFFWVRGFKEIRLYLISEFLIQLELEVNNALCKLGMPTWKITFSVEKETKSKTVKKGFHVLISSPNNKLPVPWEAWSGGESQRLRLAGTMGLSSLILRQYGISPDVEIWDEPSSHLGKEGVLDLLNTLHDRALSEGKRLWVIEHSNLEFSNFSNIVTVEKNENGSRLINQNKGILSEHSTKRD